MLISYYFCVKKLGKISNGHLGKDYFEWADFLNSPSMLNHCLDYFDGFFGKGILLHSHQRFTWFMLCTRIASSTTVTWCSFPLVLSRVTTIECICSTLDLHEVPLITLLVILSSSYFPGAMQHS